MQAHSRRALIHLTCARRNSIKCLLCWPCRPRFSGAGQNLVKVQRNQNRHAVWYIFGTRLDKECKAKAPLGVNSGGIKITGPNLRNGPNLSPQMRKTNKVDVTANIIKNLS